MKEETDTKPNPAVPANDHGVVAHEPVDPRVLRIAEAIGRLLAREHVKRRPPANDNAVRVERE